MYQEIRSIHTVELTKYNGTSATVSDSSELEQWCYWIRYSHEHTPQELRALLPGLAFLQATQELSEIQSITEEKEMYDSREKATLDYESNLMDARQEGRQEGLLAGVLAGKVQNYQELLSIPVHTIEELARKSTSELQSMIQELQKQLRLRNP
jgi:flagellar biosynthesis/type III secretory pathway protein FliH